MSNTNIGHIHVNHKKCFYNHNLISNPLETRYLVLDERFASIEAQVAKLGMQL